jgi:murein DD-endopeptidase MepM/ murein hydrolase activator NlpD
MKVLKIIFVLILVGSSGWYYMLRVAEFNKRIEIGRGIPAEVVAQKEPTRVFGMIVDDFLVEQGKIKRNQNLSEILAKHNIDPIRIGELGKASRKVYDVRRIRSNTPYTLVCSNDSLHTAIALFYEPNPIDYVAFHFEDSMRIEMNQRPVEIVGRTAAGTITNSLFETMVQLDLSPQLTNDLADVFAWQIDFFRLFPGDEFKVIFEEKLVYGNSVGLGEILGASFKHDKKEFFAVYYDQGNGIDYFDESGKSLRKALLKFPLEFTRISSRYTGRRFHPVQKIYKAHLGTDFAAPTGTPVRSVGDGIVAEAGYTSGNGNYVKIKHNGIYTTQYLHMSKFARGIQRGIKVKQGQTIGYVGSTGLARGSHLCFRFWKNGVQVDALRVDIPPSEPIAEENLTGYFLARDEILQKLSAIEVPGTELHAGGF